MAGAPSADGGRDASAGDDGRDAPAGDGVGESVEVGEPESPSSPSCAGWSLESIATLLWALDSLLWTVAAGLLIVC